MGFPTGLYIGTAFTSILEVETGGSSAPDVGFCWGSSFLTAGLTAVSLDVVLWGMFRMSLYRDWL